MTDNDFLDREKARGVIVFRCLACAFRGIGAAVTYHEMGRPEHVVYPEDWPAAKVERLRASVPR